MASDKRAELRRRQAAGRAALAVALVLTAACRKDPVASPRKASDRALASLPYLADVPAPQAERRGVVTYDRARVSPGGLNLYTSKRWTEARLADMEGQVVRRWARPARPLLEPARAVRVQEVLAGWMHVELTEDDGLFVIEELRGLTKLDRHSQPIWSLDLPAHHDLAPRPDGGAVVLSASVRLLRWQDAPDPYLDNLIVEVSGRGKVVGKRSIIDVLQGDPRTRRWLEEGVAKRAGWSRRLGPDTISLRTPEEKAAALPDLAAFLADEHALPEAVGCMLVSLTPGDLLHTNTIERLDRDWPVLGRRGDYLLSVRNLDLVLTVSARTGKVQWVYGPGELSQQHQPTITRDGHVLIFDNGVARKRSRVIEVDPRTNRIVWSYEREGFFTPYMGGVEALEGGNVLITDSTASRAFEVDRQGQIVWEYLEPTLIDARPEEARAAASRKRTLTIYRLSRAAPSTVRAFR